MSLLTITSIEDMTKRTGRNIKKFRKARRLTQSELAKAVGITENYVTLVENNRRHPSAEVLDKIARVLRIPATILTIEIEEPLGDPLEKLLSEAYELALCKARKD